MNGWSTNIVYVYTLHAASCETYMKKSHILLYLMHKLNYCAFVHKLGGS